MDRLEVTRIEDHKASGGGSRSMGKSEYEAVLLAAATRVGDEQWFADRHTGWELVHHFVPG